ncbi:MAG: glycerophosphodiester phosphodiesterase [Acidimicrobiales bacterium]
MRPQISWHRGGTELVSSATLAAFETAAEQGAEWIEVDVRRTADGMLVCVHDPHVPGLGEVAALDYSSLSCDERDKVPTLAEFLEALKRGGERASDPVGSGVHLDLKGTGHEREAVEAIRKSGRGVFVTTRHDKSIELVRASWADVGALLSLPCVEAGHGLVGLARRWAHDLWPYGRLKRSAATGIAAQHLLANVLLRRWCGRRGLTVLVWTVDSTKGLQRWLARANVDIVTTNRPMAALRLRQGPDVALVRRETA